MKVFRSAAGKCMLFLLLILCAAAIVICSAAGIYYAADELWYYTKDEYKDEIRTSYAQSALDDVIRAYVFDDPDLSYTRRRYDAAKTNLTIFISRESLQGSETLFSNSGSLPVVLADTYFIPGPESDDNFAGYGYDSLWENGFVMIGVAEAREMMPEEEVYRVRIGVRNDADVHDQLYFYLTAVDLLYTLQPWLIPAAVISVLLFVLLFIALMTVSGRRPGSEELFPGILNRVPFDLLTAVFLAGLVFLWILFDDVIVRNGTLLIIVFLLLAFPVCMGLFLGWCMSAAIRIKQKTLISGSLCGKIVHLLWQIVKKIIDICFSFLRSIPFIWKGLAVSSIHFLLVVMCLVNHSPFPALLLILAGMLVVWYYLFAMQRLKTGAEQIAKGDYTAHVDDRYLVLGLKEHADTLNAIRNGLNTAVDERTRSERMKTELITNVSHDIKTPLTSIINYSDLISKEETDNGQIREYSEILHRQSEKLKRLIDDLIEASKAATGNLDIQLAPCDLNVIVSQITGEYEERLEQAKLPMITRIPDEPVMIMADGRRLWRVFDNLMNNILKYAMPGTRVYLSMAKQNGEAIMVFKNTSKEPLDMTPEELTERFVRGDASRNTEGNGLGLSIAKSLVELQNGLLSLYADGDLFKVILRFPLCN